MAITVIVLNWNGLVHTRACVAELARVATPGLRVVVVDNGSARREDLALAEALVGFPHPLEIVRLPKNRGFAGGVNRGLEAALAARAAGHPVDAALLLNNDARLPDGFVEALEATLREHPDVGLVGTVIAEPAGLLGPGRVDWHTGDTPWAHPPYAADLVDCELAHGACLGVRLALVDDIGMLDEGYFCFYEDSDLCLRARAAGWGVRCLTRFRVEHVGGAALGRASDRRRYLFTRSRVRFILAHAPRARRLRTLAALALRIGRRGTSLAALKGFVDGLVGAPPRWPGLT
ncbi:MAG: glycosyltransferase family 2 protein [Deltaproteobacteria bacterium]|nr:glycosyltransferase family 2 protein [Deltaproteobacteria bacterium]